MGRRKFEEEKGQLRSVGKSAPNNDASLPLICERVRHYRSLRKLEQKQLAQALGITANAVSNWEQGRSRPDVALIPDLCKVLDISFF